MSASNPPLATFPKQGLRLSPIASYLLARGVVDELEIVNHSTKKLYPTPPTAEELACFEELAKGKQAFLETAPPFTGDDRHSGVWWRTRHNSLKPGEVLNLGRERIKLTESLGDFHCPVALGVPIGVIFGEARFEWCELINWPPHKPGHSAFPTVRLKVEAVQVTENPVFYISQEGDDRTSRMFNSSEHIERQYLTGGDLIQLIPTPSGALPDKLEGHWFLMENIDHLEGNAVGWFAAEIVAMIFEKEVAENNMIVPPEAGFRPRSQFETGSSSQALLSAVMQMVAISHLSPLPARAFMVATLKKFWKYGYLIDRYMLGALDLAPPSERSSPLLA